MRPTLSLRFDGEAGRNISVDAGVRYPAEMTTIERIETSDTALHVWLTGTVDPLQLPWLWVRDHSEDPVSFDPTNKQREVNTFELDRSATPLTADIEVDAIHVKWGDDLPTSILPLRLLSELALPTPGERTLWRSPQELRPEFIPYNEVMNSTEGVRQWVQHIERFGFGLVSGVPGEIGDAEALANRIGYVRRTVFGDMWTLSSEVAEHADSAYGSALLEPHTDGSYSHDGPGMQLFACVERTGTGGESVMVDGFAAAEVLRATNHAAFQQLTEVSVPAHYIEDGVELRAERPTIRLNADGSIKQVTFNNYDRSPFLLPPDEMLAWYDAYSALHELLVDQDTWWTHYLKPGEALMFDNWRCLHGRLAYTGKRVFNGCYVNHEDLESTLRVTR